VLWFDARVEISLAAQLLNVALSRGVSGGCKRVGGRADAQAARLRRCVWHQPPGQLRRLRNLTDRD